MIKLEHVRKSYPTPTGAGITPLKDVNAEIRDGEVISVIGPSGTGKSTLIHLLSGEEKPDGGTVRRFGETAVISQQGIPEADSDVFADLHAEIGFTAIILVDRHATAGKSRKRRRHHQFLHFCVSFVLSFRT